MNEINWANKRRVIEFAGCLLKMDNQVGEGSSQKLRDHKNCRGMLKHPPDEQDDEPDEQGDRNDRISVFYFYWLILIQIYQYRYSSLIFRAMIFCVIHIPPQCKVDRISVFIFLLVDIDTDLSI